MDERDYTAMNAELKNQTAVEYLEDKIQSDMTFMEVLGLIRQAKEMEKQQIIDAINKFAPDWIDSEQYYNETFKSKSE